MNYCPKTKTIVASLLVEFYPGRNNSCLKGQFKESDLDSTKTVNIKYLHIIQATACSFIPFPHPSYCDHGSSVYAVNKSHYICRLWPKSDWNNNRNLSSIIFSVLIYWYKFQFAIKSGTDGVLWARCVLACPTQRASLLTNLIEKIKHWASSNKKTNKKNKSFPFNSALKERKNRQTVKLAQASDMQSELAWQGHSTAVLHSLWSGKATKGLPWDRHLCKKAL